MKERRRPTLLLVRTLCLQNAISSWYSVVLIGPWEPQEPWALSVHGIIWNILMGSRNQKRKTLFRNPGLSPTALTSQERADILSAVYILFLLASCSPPLPGPPHFGLADKLCPMYKAVLPALGEPSHIQTRHSSEFYPPSPFYFYTLLHYGINPFISFRGSGRNLLLSRKQRRSTLMTCSSLQPSLHLHLPTLHPQTLLQQRR